MAESASGPEYEPIALPHRFEYGPEKMQAEADAYYAHIAQRHTVRHFSDKPVAEGVIRSCIRAAGTAPSGANHQPWHFVCVKDAQIKREIRIAAELEEAEFYGGKAGDRWLKHLQKIGTDAQKPFLEVAPWLIAIFAQPAGPDERGDVRKNYYVKESVGIATGFLINALHRAGLATLTHTPNPMKFLNQILRRPTAERAFLLLVAGHPAEDAEIPRYATQKKTLAEISTFV
ncbi:MAG: nitroreductase family protein [Pseudomonadota bacterium]